MSVGTRPEDHLLPLVRCPVCRARLTGQEPVDEPCRRCRSDLSRVRRAHLAAAHHRTLARRALAQERPVAAVNHALRALRLLDSPATRATAAAALHAAGSTEQACRLLGR